MALFWALTSGFMPSVAKRVFSISHIALPCVPSLNFKSLFTLCVFISYDLFFSLFFVSVSSSVVSFHLLLFSVYYCPCFFCFSGTNLSKALTGCTSNACWLCFIFCCFFSDFVIFCLLLSVSFSVFLGPTCPKLLTGCTSNACWQQNGKTFHNLKLLAELHSKNTNSTSTKSYSQKTLS